jgi:hypothetical protein
VARAADARGSSHSGYPIVCSTRGTVHGLQLFAVRRESCSSWAVSSGAGDSRSLQIEARVFSRYLVGRDPPGELIGRYERANRALFNEPVDQRDRALVGFVGRHPWSVSFLDAASGLLRPNGLLRGKILTMGAILETSPEFAEEFLPRAAHPAVLVLRLFTLGLAGVTRAVLGSLLYGVALRSRP